MTGAGALLRSAGRWIAALGTAALLGACGGGGGGGSTDGGRVAGPGGELLVAGSNVLPVRLDAGINGNSINSPYVTVTVCQPGTAVCEDIDHVLVDTGSSGLRIAASALSAGLRASMPAVTTAGGDALGQCAQFASGYAWGSVRRADARLGAETASNIAVQVIGDPGAPYAAVPAACTATGPDLTPGLGAKGILGVGFFLQDCGVACAVSTAPNVYFACGAGGGCASTTVPVASQVPQPVARLPVNNNGVVLALPPVPAGGANSLAGSLILGIGTQGNNQLSGATVYTANAQGFVTTVYKGTAYPNSFLDSGSNGLFFPDASLPVCGDFYCPSPPQTLSGTITGTNGASTSISFLVDNVATLPADAIAAHIAGDTSIAASFDWGLPFFFGRSVFVGIAGAGTPYGTGPYWAF